MNSLKHRGLLGLLLSIILWLCLPQGSLLSAEENSNGETAGPTLGSFTTKLDQAENRLKNYLNDEGKLINKEQLQELLDKQSKLLDDITENTVDAAKFAQDCITAQEARIAKAAQSLEGLGEVNPNDALHQERKRLQQDKAALEKELGQCRLLNVRATNIQESAQSISQQLLRNRLFARSPSLLDYSLNLLRQPTALQQEIMQLLQTLVTQPVNPKNLYMALIYGGIGMLAGLFWSIYRQHQNLDASQNKLALTSPALATVWNSLIRAAPILLLAGLVNLSFLFHSPGLPALNDLSLTILVFSVSYAILHAMLRPSKRLNGFSPLIPTTSRKLFYWGRLLLFTTLLGALFQSSIFDRDPPANLIGLLRITLGTLVGLALIRVVWLLRKHLTVIHRFHLLPLAGLTILTAIGALWAGYNNFSEFLFKGVFGTLFILLIGWLLIRIPVEIFDGLDEARAPWQQRLRNRMGLASGQIVPGLIWLRLLHVLVIGGLIIVALLRLWGVSDQSLTVMAAKFVSGYEIGGFTLEPMALLYGLLALALLIILTQFVKRSLSSSWLRRTNLSRGAKEATVTITGYTGMALAVLIGLSVAGINFSNLAIIAGALSVGIGFGLQNIVNNFISGLILLFERPIRRGDWIRVGTSEGYVKDISIRSTVIHTFDRSDIIVPNSELIANQVTNMMLNNQFGRVIIKLRIAYGADTDQVLEIMHNVAEQHPAVLREHGQLQINTLLRSFGETAMHFELRCIIRDVELILDVTSDLNLALEKAFRAAGIEFPLPQQIVQLRSVDQGKEEEAASTATASPS
ncbi:MAG: mechanosensitive ion channel [Thiolinea sp.]